MAYEKLGYSQTQEVQGGTKLVKVREYRRLALPSETYYQFRRPQGKWGAATIDSVSEQFAGRIEDVLGNPLVTDVVYSQDTTAGGKLIDMMTTYYQTADGLVDGSVESSLAEFGPNFTGAQVADEKAAGGDKPPCGTSRP